MSDAPQGLVCLERFGTGWIDRGTRCLAHSNVPGAVGFLASSRLGVLPADPWQVAWTTEFTADGAGNGELSGALWVGRFPTSADLADLSEPFGSNVRKFLTAIANAGGTTGVSATYRPPERAYLMHYAAKLARREVLPEQIPSMAGVDINWVHPTESASIAAAKAMVAGYGIVYPPALRSNHTQRTAIDVTIRGMVGREIVDGDGKKVSIKKMADLYPVGASYGVIKLESDPPHWSIDGH